MAATPAATPTMVAVPGTTAATAGSLDCRRSRTRCVTSIGSEVRSSAASVAVAVTAALVKSGAHARCGSATSASAVSASATGRSVAALSARASGGGTSGRGQRRRLHDGGELGEHRDLLLAVAQQEPAVADGDDRDAGVPAQRLAADDAHGRARGRPACLVA